ncbi:MAG: hypothetical protein DRQ40_00455 [Gammaproteobacteria bacterium]|nr:MAG: hypothetical protein DRQ40_00455 [Gammaproteobacteria bacterium]
MAITETVKDIELNPSISKTATLDMDKVVLVDSEGDEKYVLTCTTTATAAGAEAISDIYIRDFKIGYSKSSGFKNPPYTITSSTNQILVSIDGSTFRPIILEVGSGLTGNNIAEDLQEKISAHAAAAALEEGNLSFLNCTVIFENGRITILSGSLSNTYTGLGRSSVNVVAGLLNDASVTLGFDIPTESESLSSERAVESTLASSFTASGTTLLLTSVEDMNADEAYTITDGANREYFIVDTVTSGGAQLTVAANSIINDYASGSIVQRIFEKDASSDLASPIEDIDAIYRFGLKSLANQMDFSS